MPVGKLSSKRPMVTINENMPCRQSGRGDCSMFCPWACVAVGINMWLILLWTCSNKGIFCHKDADNMDGTLVADNHFVIFTTILILNSYANTKRTLAHKYQGFIPGVPNFEAMRSDA